MRGNQQWNDAIFLAVIRGSGRRQFHASDATVIVILFFERQNDACSPLVLQLQSWRPLHMLSYQDVLDNDTNDTRSSHITKECFDALD